MGVRYPSNGNQTIVNAAVNGTTETVVLTSTSLNLQLDFQQVLIYWYLIFTVGTGQTSVKLTLRRGTTATGTVINVPTALTAVAANLISLSGCYTDTPGIVANQQWSLTVTQAGGAGNGTVSDGCMALIAL